MKRRIAAGVLVVALVALLVNAVVVTRATRSAEPFACGTPWWRRVSGTPSSSAIRWVARVAAELARQYPDLVGRVVVSDTPGADGLVTMPLLGKMVCWPVIGPVLDRSRGIRAIAEGSLQTGFAADYPVPDYAYRSLERLTYAGVCDSKEGKHPVADTLAALGKPVLVVWSAEDVLTPTGPNVARYTETGPAPHVIAGAGHSPMVEKPEEFLTTVTDFVR